VQEIVGESTDSSIKNFKNSWSINKINDKNNLLNKTRELIRLVHKFIFKTNKVKKLPNQLVKQI
jgi:hypothetical protein